MTQFWMGAFRSRQLTCDVPLKFSYISKKAENSLLIFPLPLTFPFTINPSRGVHYDSEARGVTGLFRGAGTGFMDIHCETSLDELPAALVESASS